MSEATCINCGDIQLEIDECPECSSANFEDGKCQDCGFTTQ